jgi:hypothetical protein
MAHRPGESASRVAVLRDRRPDPGTGVVSQRCAGRASPPGAQGGSQATVRAPSAAPRARRRAAARGNPVAPDPAAARPLAPVNDRDLPRGDQQRGDHLDRPRKAPADDARQCRARPLAKTCGSADALPRSAPRKPSSRRTSAILLARTSVLRAARWSALFAQGGSNLKRLKEAGNGSRSGSRATTRWSALLRLGPRRAAPRSRSSAASSRRPHPPRPV